MCVAAGACMVEAQEVGEKHSDRDGFMAVEKTQIHAAVCVRVLPSGPAPLGGREVLVFTAGQRAGTRRFWLPERR